MSFWSAEKLVGNVEYFAVHFSIEEESFSPEELKVSQARQRKESTSLANDNVTNTGEERNWLSLLTLAPFYERTDLALEYNAN